MGTADALGARSRTFRLGDHPALRVLAAEALKQHRTLFRSRLVVFSLFLWPAIELASTYYAFRPFAAAPGLSERWPLAADQRGILLFFATGALGYTFFYSLVQSAWHFAFERVSGTLELLFLTPANRLVLVLSNGAMSLAQDAWLFLAFVTGLFMLVGRLELAHPAMLLVAFVGLLVPAVAWGTFLNSLFLFSRDAGFLYTVFQEPMEFFAGTRIPLFALPVWAQVAGVVFPLTSSLVVLRGALLEARTAAELWPQLATLSAISALLLASSAVLLRWGEARAKRSGTLVLF